MIRNGESCNVGTALRGMEQRAKERTWVVKILCGCNRECRRVFEMQDALCAWLGVPAFSSSIPSPPPSSADIKVV